MSLYSLTRSYRNCSKIRLHIRTADQIEGRQQVPNQTTPTTTTRLRLIDTTLETGRTTGSGAGPASIQQQQQQKTGQNDSLSLSE